VDIGTVSALLLVSEVRGITSAGEKKMLWTIFVILLVMWLLGLVTGTVFGGFIHLLLILAVVVVVVQLVTGRRAV
jgi:hypothetical protein